MNEIDVKAKRIIYFILALILIYGLGIGCYVYEWEVLK